MNIKSKLGTRQFFNRYGLIAVIVLVAVVFSATNTLFLLPDNLINIARQMAVVAIVSVGMTFVMISGDIDVGVGGVACLTGMIVSLTMKAGVNMWLALLLGLFIGAILGAINGLLVTSFSLPSMVVTLAMMNFANGVASILTGGTAVYGLPDEFLFIGRGSLFFIPTQVIILVVLAVMGIIVLRKTPFGRHVYAIGGNKEVAKLSGINVKRIRILLYIVSGICAAIGGIILTSRTASGQPNLATTMNMNVITAVAIGGTSLNGGSGTIGGSLLGALLLTMITNGLNVNGIDSFWQLVVSAIVLIITIIAYRNE